jgi:hypothetical protein
VKRRAVTVKEKVELQQTRLDKEEAGKKKFSIENKIFLFLKNLSIEKLRWNPNKKQPTLPMKNPNLNQDLHPHLHLNLVRNPHPLPPSPAKAKANPNGEVVAKTSVAVNELDWCFRWVVCNDSCARESSQRVWVGWVAALPFTSLVSWNI